MATIRLLGALADVSKFVCVAAKVSLSRFGNVNPIPFRRRVRMVCEPPLEKKRKKKDESLLPLLPPREETPHA